MALLRKKGQSLHITQSPYSEVTPIIFVPFPNEKTKIVSQEKINKSSSTNQKNRTYSFGEKNDQMVKYFNQVWLNQAGVLKNPPQKKRKKKKKVKQPKTEFDQALNPPNENEGSSPLNVKVNNFYDIQDNDTRQKSFSIDKTYLYQSYEPSPVWRTSSSTLRHSSFTTQFPREKRFSEIKQNSVDQSTLIIPSTLGVKSCTIGFGEKQYVPSSELRRNIENPSPGQYNLQQKLNVPNISLGTQEKFFAVESRKKYPGPGSYNTRSVPGQGKCSFTMGDTSQPQEIKQSSGPYLPNNNQVTPSRFKRITFGRGNKSSMITVNGVPGPGQYKIASKFDKLTNLNRSFDIIRSKMAISRYDSSRTLIDQDDFTDKISRKSSFEYNRIPFTSPKEFLNNKFAEILEAANLN